MLSFIEARQKVIEVVGARRKLPPRERIEIGQALSRVLAEQVVADRDYPPFDRATRDGFAVRAGDLTPLPATLEIIGEIKAGDTFAGTVGAGQCVEIMTGAGVPPGADAVVMIEHTKPSKSRVLVERAVEPWQNIVRRGSEARAGQVLLQPGTRLGYAELALAAQVGAQPLPAYVRPRVAILSTGDEVVGLDEKPGPFQIRNGNSVSLVAQVALAGAVPVALGNAPDRMEELRARVERGLDADVLLLSGGVSMGKYDLVAAVLRALGAEFFFAGVAIRPGRPAVFCACREKFVFGLPGNPVSTMVTFELFGLPAIDLLSGAAPRPLPLLRARVARPLSQKAALTHFLPGQLAWSNGEPIVRELPWQGSGDLVTLAQANCFLLVPPTKLSFAAGEWVDVLPRRDVW
ncbi:MAG TPA: gephyrin-like molybdotransferase Glp [Candidatus Acidoferrales bacterium]|nr:gephyrin-like molybdotransferase Glp [Candidatus Acidoferrales bacterium]